jgi:hypothetical protein
MEEGCQKYRSLLYTTKFKCTGEKGYCKATAILESMKATFISGGNTRQQSARVRHRERNSLAPKRTIS